MPDYTTTKVTTYPGHRRPRDYELPGIVGEDTLAGPDGVARGTGWVTLDQTFTGDLLTSAVPVSPGQRITVELEYDPGGSADALLNSESLQFRLVTGSGVGLADLIIEVTTNFSGSTASPRRIRLSFVSAGHAVTEAAPFAAQRYFQIQKQYVSGTFSVRVKAQYHIHPLNS